MYSRKSVGQRMEPWGTPALTGYSCEDFPSRTSRSRLLLRKRNKAKYLTWNYTSLRFAKKASMTNPFKSLGYIKCYSSSSPRPVKSPSNSIRYNCHKISWEDLKPYWKSRKKVISLGDQLFASFSKTLLTTERRLTES